MSPEIIGITTTNSTVETEYGLVNFNFASVLVQSKRELSTAAQLSNRDGVVELAIQLAVPNNPNKLKDEFKKVREQAFTMQSGLAAIEKMRHSLFDYDYVDKFFYDGIRWKLSSLAISHSLASQKHDVRKNRFRLDNPYVLEKFIPVIGRLKTEEDLYGITNQMLHESIINKTNSVMV
jgi:hypothetical protein